MADAGVMRGVVLRALGASGATLEAPGLLWGAFGSHVGRFLGIFWGSEAGSGAEGTQK